MGIYLNEIKVGEKSEILNIKNSSISTKLAEMGFIKGQTIEVVFSAPFGDPIAVELNGSVLSLRLEEAATIEVEKTNSL